ncbi:MAG: hypothetical protein OEY17_03115 [Nitrosopumilus sp.]|nr:hypothetical protein [Nitrosopumilus sp.]
MLLQKSNGNPACVLPSTYLKLIQRGYGNYDASIMSKRPAMMYTLMQNMVSNQNIMYHWHEMMQKNPRIMMDTVDDWVSQMKDNPVLLKNMLGPMTSDPQLREMMIDTMKNNHHMENSLKMNSQWMDSVHHPMINSEMDQRMHHSTCSWCPDYQMSISEESFTGFDYDGIINMMHNMWTNSGISKDMNKIMLQNPSHMANMSEQMMEPMLNAIMDDEDLRQRMIDLLLEHQDFMNTVRHENIETEN